MALRSNVQALILGKTGAGKSLLARCLFARYPLAGARDYYLSVSTKEDHFLPPPPSEGPSCEIYFRKLGFSHLRLGPEHARAKFRLSPALRHQPRLCLTLEGLGPEEAEYMMDEVGKTLLRLGHSVLLLDEADLLVPRNHPPRWMLDLVRRGRYRGVDLIIVSHNDTDIHNAILENTNLLICFAMRHPTRIERLRWYFDDPRVLADLAQYEYAWFDEVTGASGIGSSSQDLARLRADAPHLFSP